MPVRQLKPGAVFSTLALVLLALLAILVFLEEDVEEEIPAILPIVTESTPLPESDADFPSTERPRINEIEPESVYPGTLVTIRGDYLAWKKKPRVTFAKIEAEVHSFNHGQIITTVPLETPAGQVKVRVFRDGAKSRPFRLYVKNLNVFKMTRIIVGGIAFFIFGLVLLSSGLRQYAGSRMRTFFRAATGSWPLAALWGSILSLITQSATSACLLTLGLVNAGLIAQLPAAVLMLGTGLGAAATALIIHINITKYALIAVALGVLLSLTQGRRSLRRLGKVILGIGLLFYGLHLIKNGFSPMYGHPFLSRFFSACDATTATGRLAAVILGALLTFILQGHGAVVALVIGISQTTSLMSFATGLAILLGSNLGVPLATLPASLAMDPASRKTAAAHAVITLIWTLICIVSLGWIAHLTDLIIPGLPDAIDFTSKVMRPSVGIHLAAAFAITSILPLIVFGPILKSASSRLFTSTSQNGKKPHAFIMKHASTEIALMAARKMLHSLILSIEPMLKQTKNLIIKRDRTLVDEIESTASTLSSDIEEAAALLSEISRTDSDTENTGAETLSYALNSARQAVAAAGALASEAERIFDHEKPVASGHVRHIEIMSSAVGSLIEMAAAAAEDEDSVDAAGIRMAEISLNRADETAKKEAIAAVNSGELSPEEGFFLVSIYSGFEQVGNYVYRFAEELTSAVSL